MKAQAHAHLSFAFSVMLCQTCLPSISRLLLEWYCPKLQTEVPVAEVASLELALTSAVQLCCPSLPDAGEGGPYHVTLTLPPPH